MNAYDAAEQGYKNGFEAGYQKAIEDGMIKLSFWKLGSDGNKYCAKCGMLEPDSLPGACVIWPNEKRYCFYCGSKMQNVEGA